MKIVDGEYESKKKGKHQFETMPAFDKHQQQKPIQVYDLKKES